MRAIFGKRMIALMLAALLTLACFAGCAESMEEPENNGDSYMPPAGIGDAAGDTPTDHEPDGDRPTDAVGDATGELGGTTETEPTEDLTDEPTKEPEGESGEEQQVPPLVEPERLPIELPQVDGGGQEICFLTMSVEGFPSLWPELPVVLPREPQDTLDRAVWMRNATVEELMNVVITEECVPHNQIPSALKRPIMVGECKHHAMIVDSARMALLCVQEGIARNMHEMTGLNPDMPWWSQSANEAFTLGGKLYFAVPEMMMRDKLNTAAVFYNKTLAEQSYLSDLATLVSDGEWTQEALIALCEEAYAFSDACAMTGMDDTAIALYAGEGRILARVEEDGSYTEVYGDVESTDALQNIFDTIIGEAFFAHESERGAPSFAQEQTLFHINYLSAMLTDGVLCESYGVLPMPKADESQRDYYSYVSPVSSSLLAFPVTVWEEEEALAVPVVEAMNYISYYDVSPTLYEAMLDGSVTVSDKDREMLSLVIESRFYDFGQIPVTREGFARSALADNIVRAAVQNDLDAERLGTEGLYGWQLDQEVFARCMERLLR